MASTRITGPMIAEFCKGSGLGGAGYSQITLTIPEFCEKSGLGKTKVYELLDAGAVESIRIGRRRLVVQASYEALVARLIAEQAA